MNLNHNSIFIKKYPIRVKITDLIKQADDIMLSSGCYLDNMIFKFAIKLKNLYKSDIEIIQSELDFNQIFTKNGISDDLENIIHKTPAINDRYIDYGLLWLLSNSMKHKKVIFIFLDLINYSLEENKNDSIMTHVTHATCLMLHPENIGNKYNAYFFNSHGEAVSTDTLEYEKYITRRRNKKVILGEPLDFYVLKHYIQIMNKYDNININYDYSIKHNYLGPNLQSGDNYGICYVFPFYILYELITNLNNPIIADFPSFDECIINDNTTKGICCIMEKHIQRLNYKKFLNDLFITTNFSKYNNGFRKYMEKKNTYYVKYLLYKLCRIIKLYLIGNSIIQNATG